MILPKVTIAIPTCYEKNQRYLDLALRSIENLDYEKEKIEIIVVASNGFVPVVAENIRLITLTERVHFAPAVNLGFSHASADSEYFFIVSDDVVLTKSCLKNMVTQLNGQEAVMGPISNCENGWRYNLLLGFENDGVFNHLISRQYRFDETLKFHDAMMNAESVYPMGNIQSDILCFFSVLIPKSVWEKVGGLDERFLSGQEDVDFCKRAKVLGIPVVYALNSLIWHFSGVTADEMLDQATRDESIRRFDEKYA